MADARSRKGLAFLKSVLAKLRRALLVVVCLTTGAWLRRAGRLLKTGFFAGSSSPRLSRSSRCSFNLRATASPGSSKVERVGGLVDLVGWKGARWMELMRFGFVRVLVASAAEEVELIPGASPRSDPSTVFDVNRGDIWVVFRLWNALAALVVILLDLTFDGRAALVDPVGFDLFDPVFPSLDS